MTTMEFQSAPRAYTRGDIIQWGRLDAFTRFNPRPGLTPEATIRGRAAGDGHEFQSAPRAYTRGDCRRARSSSWLVRFNPRPGLTPEATAARLRFITSTSVSIRAPGLHPRRRNEDK